jgi:predicted dienelactone hydrolase
MYNALGTMRSIPVKVYYPVTKESVEGLPKARYMSKATVDAIRKNFYVPIKYEKVESNGTNRSECYENAPFIESERFPLIIFNYGYCSFLEANTYLLIELASHGYVVASVGHPYEGMITEFDDGTTLKMAKGIAPKADSPMLPSILSALKLQKAKGTNEELWERFDAMQKKYNRFIIERLPEWELDTKAALRVLKDKYSRMIDLENGIGVTGHSMGGATAFALCEDEPETFTCGINIDGGLFGIHDGKVITTPFLQMNCESNKTAVMVAFVKNKNIAYHAVLRDMQHLGFSDMKHVIPLKSQVGKLDPDIAHKTVCGIHLEFFDTYLKKAKNKPSFDSNDAVTFTEYEPQNFKEE